MPLATNASYLTTLDEFLEHWAVVENAAGPFALPNGTTRADCAALRNEYAALQARIHAAERESEQARAERDAVRAQLAPAIVQFNTAARRLGAVHPLTALLPNSPGANVAYDRVLNAANTVATIWERINALTPGSVPGLSLPLVVPDGFTQSGLLTRALFTARRDEFAVKVSVSLEKEQNARAARDKRTVLKARISDVLTTYRTTIIARARPKSTIRTTLPSVYPRPGSIPPPVTLTGQWHPDKSVAVLTITPLVSSVADKFAVVRYVARFCTSDEYNPDEEQTAGSLSLEETTLETNAGLAAAGSIAHFRVYAVTKAGTERGGNVVTIAR